jgi:hypothetical protein
MGVDRLGKRNEGRWITGVSMGQWEGYEGWEQERLEHQNGINRQG